MAGPQRQVQSAAVLRVPAYKTVRRNGRKSAAQRFCKAQHTHKEGNARSEQNRTDRKSAKLLKHAKKYKSTWLGLGII